MVTKRVVLLSLMAVAGTIAASILVTAQQGAPGNRAAITAAAQALGGLDRIRALRNIRLEGYGMYAYQFGGGNITGHPNAPMKFQAANDLRRTYDLQNGRWLLQERRNFLFPFAGIGGHSYALVSQYLDGDISFNVTEKGAQRTLRNDPQILQHDGVHMRRMWMHNNPIVLVRAALDPSTTVSAPRKEGSLTIFDLQLKEGDKLSMAIAPVTNLPEWVRWTNPHNDLGQVTYTTYFTGYVPYGGVMLPLGYRTLIDWRNVEYFKIYVDNYVIDGEIPDMAAPESVRSAPEPQPQPIKVQATEVAKGIWRLTPGGTNVFEFADHLTLYELGGGIRQAEAIIAFARTLVPGKPVTQVITSHHHFDHTAGLRQGIAEGLTVIGRRGNEGIFREMAMHPSPDWPDLQEKNKRQLKFIPVDEHLRLSDSQMTVDIYWDRANIHMADAVFAYVPAAKVMVEGDMATAALDYQFWGDNYLDNIEHYKLDVETLSPVHMQIMKHPAVIEMIRGGVQRARERCAAELAKNNYFPGCPIQSKRF